MSCLCDNIQYKHSLPASACTFQNMIFTLFKLQSSCVAVKYPSSICGLMAGVFCSLGSTSSVYDNQRPHKGHHESTTSPGETATTKIDSQPRSARVPGGFLKSNVLKIQWQNCLHMNWSKRWKWRSNALFRLCCATDCIQHFTSSLKDGAYCNSYRFSAILG